MSEEIIKIIIPGIIALLIIWLIYPIKAKIQHVVKKEIYDDFPSIKNSIDNFQRRIEYLNAELDSLEAKIKELEGRSK